MAHRPSPYLSLLLLLVATAAVVVMMKETKADTPSQLFLRSFHEPCHSEVKSAVRDLFPLAFPSGDDEEDKEFCERLMGAEHIVEMEIVNLQTPMDHSFFAVYTPARIEEVGGAKVLERLSVERIRTPVQIHPGSILLNAARAKEVLCKKVFLALYTGDQRQKREHLPMIYPRRIYVQKPRQQGEPVKIVGDYQWVYLDKVCYPAEDKGMLRYRIAGQSYYTDRFIYGVKYEECGFAAIPSLDWGELLE